MSVYAHTSSVLAAMAPIVGDEKYNQRGTTTHFVVHYAQSLGSNGPVLADAVLARCEADFASLQSWFGGIAPSSLPFNIYIRPGTNGASHGSCSDTSLYCDAFTGTDGDLERSLVVAEEDEVFMANQALGWDCAASNGEGLSRVLAAELYPAELTPPGTGVTFATAANWLDSSRPDWVSNNDPAAGTGAGYNPVSIGCSTLFINYLHYQLGFSWNQIVQAGGSTLSKTYATLTGDSESNAFTRFLTVISSAYPLGIPSGLATDNPFPLGSLLEFYKEPNPAPWQAFNHTTETGALIASDPDQCFLLDSEAHLLTRGRNGNPLEFVKDPNPAPWQVLNLTPLTNRTVASTPRTLVTGNTLHVYARGDDGHLLEFYKDPDPAPWQVFDHTTDTGMPIRGNPELLMTGSTLHLFVSGVDGHLLEFYKEPNPAPWQVFDHTADTGTSIQGDVTSFLTGDSVHVFATGLDGHLLEFYKEPNPTPWQVFDHTADTGRAITGKPSVLTIDPGPTVHVFARGSDGHLLEFYKEPNPAPWQVFDHTTDTGRSIGWPPTMIQVSNSTHVFAAGDDGHLLEFYKEPNPAPWQVFDHTLETQTTIAGTPTLLLTGSALHVFARSD